GPVDPDGVVDGKKLAVVLEDDKVQRADLAIGGVDVGDVNVAFLQSAVSVFVVEGTDSGIRNIQTVGSFQRSPAIVALPELLGESVSQIGMITQVGDGANPTGAGNIGPHTEAVGVTEAERMAHAQTALGESGLQIAPATKDVLA